MNGINKVMVYSIYIHIPFCQRRCNYCDFVTYAGMEQYISAYVNSLIEEFRIVTDCIYQLPVHSIYFGGGTPSLIPINIYKRIFAALGQHFYMTSDCEISIEANPGTLSYNYLQGLKALGITRLSIGAQSLHPYNLKRLGRIHSIDDIYQSIADARRVGFENINLDLIFGLPWQTQSEWVSTLKKAISLNVEHFSLYSLILEPGTKLFEWYQKGLIIPQDQDKEGDLYEISMSLLENAGYGHYEISNWEKKDQNKKYQCRHNLQYWFGQPYLGFGAGAHGFTGDIRTANVTGILDYCSRLSIGCRYPYEFPQSPGSETVIKLGKLTQMREFMMMGLRLVEEGVSIERFTSNFHCSMLEIFGKEIKKLVNDGLLEWTGDDNTRLKLTKRGIMLGNRVFMVFV